MRETQPRKIAWASVKPTIWESDYSGQEPQISHKSFNLVYLLSFCISSVCSRTHEILDREKASIGFNFRKKGLYLSISCKLHTPFCVILTEIYEMRNMNLRDF